MAPCCILYWHVGSIFAVCMCKNSEFVVELHTLGVFTVKIAFLVSNRCTHNVRTWFLLPVNTTCTVKLSHKSMLQLVFVVVFFLNIIDWRRSFFYVNIYLLFLNLLQRCKLIVIIQTVIIQDVLWGSLHPIPLTYRIMLHMPKNTILTMLYNTLKNYAQQLQWSREFAICLFNLSKLAKNMLRTLLIGYYISDMGYKKKGGNFVPKLLW